MRVEMLVFAGNESVTHHYGDVIERNPKPVLAIEIRERRAVSRKDLRRAFGLKVGHPVDVRQMLRIRRNDARDRPARKQNSKNRNQAGDAEKSSKASAAATLASFLCGGTARDCSAARGGAHACPCANCFETDDSTPFTKRGESSVENF